MQLTIRVEQCPEGRWIAEVAELAWVVGHGATREEAICRAEQAAVEEIAERIGSGDLSQTALSLAFEVTLTPPPQAPRPAPSSFSSYLHSLSLPGFGRRA